MKKSIFALMLAAYAFSYAQAEVIGLGQTVAYAVANSPLAAEKNALRLSQTADGLDSARLANPEVGFEYRFGGGIDEFTAAQPLRLSDITGSRHAYKKLLTEISGLEERLDFLNITQQTQTAYYELYILQEEEGFSRRRLQFLKEAEKYINNSINFNGMSEAEVIAFGADLLSLQTQSKNLAFTLNHEQLVFLRFLNLDLKAVTLKKPDSVFLPAIEKVLSAAAQNPSPKKMLELKMSLAEKELGLINKDRYLPLILAGVKYRAEERSWNPAVTIEIPLWNLRKNTYKARKAEVAKEKALLSVFDKIPLEEIIKKSYLHLSNQIETVDAYQTKIMPLYEKASRKTEDGFLRGQASVIDVWQILEKQLDAQSGYLNSLKTMLEAKTELELLIGGPLEDIK